MLKSDFLNLEVGEKIRVIKNEPGWDSFYGKVFTVINIGSFWVDVDETSVYFYYNEIERG